MSAPTDSSAADFRLLFESAPGLYLVLNPDLTIVAASDAYLEATMTQRAEIVGRGLFEVFPDNPADPSASGVSNLRRSLERVLTRRRPDAMAVQKYDVRRASDGRFEERYWSPINAPVFGRDGEIAWILHRVEDVTDFVRSASEPGAGSAQGEDVRARAAAMGADVYRRAQEIQDANQELRGLHAILEARIQARTGELQSANAELERQIAERQRTEEALRRTEEQFRQAQKLEAIGRLAGGIAHDFNNLLSVILIYSESLLEDLGPAHPASTALAEIRRAGERASDLTRQLLAFGRKQVLEPRVLDLNETLAGMEAMLRRLLGEDVELRIARAPGLGRVRADPGQIEQVVMNLVVNARDAMAAGGRITIETANVELGPVEAGSLGVAGGAGVLLSVSDTGIGMDEATQRQIFEPFFTTKERGKGTGLGLSTVFGIVKQSGGAIRVSSAPGAGATFQIHLPRTDVEARPAPSAPRAREAADRRETILLVEDEAELRRLAATILERSGYRVLSASGGEEALRICGQHAGRIDLLLTDVIMPGLDGRQVAERAAALRPDMRVLYMSGYTDDVILQRGALEPGAAFLQKPLSSRALDAKVREVLDAPA